MGKNIHPAAGTAIALVVAVVIGFLSWKMFAAPHGIPGTPPASMSNPNGGGPAKPTNTPGAGGPGSGGHGMMPSSGGGG